MSADTQSAGPAIAKLGRAGRIQPFDMSGIGRGADGILRYETAHESLIAVLRLNVDTVPQREALVEIGGGRVDYSTLWEQSARVAGGLAEAGVKRGDRVGIRLPNGLAWCYAFYGALMAGAIAVPINTRLTEKEIEYIVGDCGIRQVLEPSRPLPSGRPMVRDDIRSSDIATIFYTSGTTGFPKGAMLSHANLLATTESIHRVCAFPYDALRSLVSVPLFHVTGSIGQLLTTVLLRGTVVIMPAFSVDGLFDAIAAEATNALISVPAIYRLALRSPRLGSTDVSVIRWLNYGGAPTPPAVVLELLNAFPHARLGNGFGLTETSALATFQPHEYASVRPECVGFAVPVVELDLALVEGEADIGELLIRGPNVGLGYWERPDATEAAFGTGWLRTGDFARIDADGFCQILDRRKDMINRGGENVYCVEVENTLAAYDGVVDVAVVGVPDDVMGEKVGAVIVIDATAPLDVNDLIRFARERLADYKIPQYLHMQTEPLPRNPSGKVLKPTLKQTSEWSPV